MKVKRKCINYLIIGMSVIAIYNNSQREPSKPETDVPPYS